MRLIDADELFKTPMPCSRGNGKPLTSLWAYVVDQITNAPTIDAVPVVRCKDCVNGTVYTNLQGAKCVDCVLDDYSVRKPDDFCSYGERKDGAE